MACPITLSSLYGGASGTVTYLGYNATAGSTVYPAPGSQWGANPANPVLAPNAAGSAVVVGNPYTTIDSTGATPGFYGFLNTSGSGSCQDFEISFVEVKPKPNSGTANPAATSFCQLVGGTVALSTLLTAGTHQTTGTWSVGPGSPAFPTQNANIVQVGGANIATTQTGLPYGTSVTVPVGAASGTYFFTYTVPAVAGAAGTCTNCAASTVTVSFTVINTPSAGTASPQIVCN